MKERRKTYAGNYVSLSNISDMKFITQSVKYPSFDEYCRSRKVPQNKIVFNDNIQFISFLNGTLFIVPLYVL